nr:diaminopimelate epimerase [uncultured Allomuricauda sp.]
MRIEFYKYQGTGNDFILVDNRRNTFPKKDADLIAKLCDRRFGIGADGLILLENDKMSDFKMIYFNADGGESTMCGNGGRCLVAFAKHLGIIGTATSFRAIDGLHTAYIEGNTVRLKMSDVPEIKEKVSYSFLNTGSPHHVQLVKNLDTMDVKVEGAKLRYGLYGKLGSNINFVSQSNGTTFEVRTYERGVENETLSCGTGVTAVALAMHSLGKTQSDDIKIKTRGGALNVTFEIENGKYHHIFLTGSAAQVFKGIWEQ